MKHSVENVRAMSRRQVRADRWAVLISIAFACGVTLGHSAIAQTPLGTSFTYQGRLTNAGIAASGSYDLSFTLYDTLTDGGVVGVPVALPGVSVSGGIFTVTLDFGAAPFAGSKRWLEIGVKPAGAGGGYTTLAPRQELTPTPAALFSTTAGNAVALGGIASSGYVLTASVIGVDKGGTGAVTAAGARANLQTAQSGANSDITSLAGLTTPVSVAQGGTGAATASAALTALNAQARLSSACPGGQSLSGVNADGSVICVGNESGCPGPRVRGVCMLSWNNTQNTSFFAAASICAAQGGDICTDSQSWQASVGAWQNLYLQDTVLTNPHWTASFADNDQSFWTGANGGTGDDHSPNSSYGYACCGGTTPPDARISVQTFNNVKVTYVHNVADTYFPGAVGICTALQSDICSDSQTMLLRNAGQLSVPTWTNSHADNDASLYNAINGGTSDDTHPSHQHGFACFVRLCIRATCRAR